MSAARETAERALAAAGRREALARVVSERSLMLRFARSRPTQATSVEDQTVELVVVHDGHVGRAATNQDDERSLRECADGAAAAAAGAAAKAGLPGAYPGLPSGAPARVGRGYDAPTAALSADVGGAALADAFAACGEAGVEAHGVWTAAAVETAVASSAGAHVAERSTDAFMKVTAIAAGGRSGYESAAGVAVSAIDTRAVAAAAAAKAAAGEPVRLPPGDYAVVLAPAAVGELLELLAQTAFDGLAHGEGHGALVGRLGTRVAAASVNLADSPCHPRTLPRSVDAEGVAKAPMPLIEDGVARAVVHDTASAALASAHSTGHALSPGGGSAPRPTNLVLTGGGARDERALAAPIEHGVYLTRLWYTNVLRGNETLITGMTRDGTFLIEGGEIARPAADMRLNVRILDVLDGVEDLTADAVLASEGNFYGRRFATGVVCPAIRSWMRFTA